MIPGESGTFDISFSNPLWGACQRAVVAVMEVKAALQSMGVGAGEDGRRWTSSVCLVVCMRNVSSHGRVNLKVGRPDGVTNLAPAPPALQSACFLHDPLPTISCRMQRIPHAHVTLPHKSCVCVLYNPRNVTEL
jgi:hypothetical protein